MALNIKGPTAESLAAELAALTNDSKTGAIRSALEAQLERVSADAERQGRGARLRRFLADEAWPQLPIEVHGRPVTKKEREEILGIGPEGV